MARSHEPSITASSVLFQASASQRCDRRHIKIAYSMARRIAVNIAKLPKLLAEGGKPISARLWAYP
jgi:hypothetical protein